MRVCCGVGVDVGLAAGADDLRRVPSLLRCAAHVQDRRRGGYRQRSPIRGLQGHAPRPPQPVPRGGTINSRRINTQGARGGGRRSSSCFPFGFNVFPSSLISMYACLAQAVNARPLSRAVVGLLRECETAMVVALAMPLKESGGSYLADGDSGHDRLLSLSWWAFALEQVTMSHALRHELHAMVQCTPHRMLSQGPKPGSARHTTFNRVTLQSILVPKTSLARKTLRIVRKPCANRAHLFSCTRRRWCRTSTPGVLKCTSSRTATRAIPTYRPSSGASRASLSRYQSQWRRTSSSLHCTCGTPTNEEVMPTTVQL